MKITKRILFLLCSLLIIQTSGAQITNADTMVHRIFATLKAKDEKAYLALYPRPQQMSKLLGKMFKGIAMEMQKAQAKNEDANQPMSPGNNKGLNIDSLLTAEFMKKATPEELAKTEKKYAKKFNDMIELGEQKGINWTSVYLANYTIDTINATDEGMIQLFGSDQFKAMKGVLHFKSGDSAFQLSFDQVMFIPDEGGWYGVTLKKLVREGESIEDEMETEVDKDESQLTMPVDTTMNKPSETKTKTKAKTKTQTSKIKTKTKTSATKTKTKTKS